MMLRLIKLTLGILLITTLFNIGTVSASESGNKVISNEKVKEMLINDEIIVEKVLKGEDVDTEYTKVNLIEDEDPGTQTIEIDRVLSETLYQNGQTEIEAEKTAIVLNSSTGSKTETAYPNSRSTSVKVIINYNKKSIKGISTVKMTSFKVIPKRLDSQFKLTKLQYEARSYGSGYTAGGKAMTKTETTGRIYVSNPSSGSSYSKSISSWKKYVGTLSGSTGVNGKLTYKRNSNGKTYSFNYSVGI